MGEVGEYFGDDGDICAGAARKNQKEIHDTITNDLQAREEKAGRYKISQRISDQSKKKTCLENLLSPQVSKIRKAIRKNTYIEGMQD